MRRSSQASDAQVVTQRRTSLRNHTIAAASSTAFQGLTRFLTTWVVGRLGGAALLGTISAVQSLSMVAATLFPFSAGSAATRFTARSRGRTDPDELRQVVGHTCKRTMQSSILLGILAVPTWALAFEGSLPEGAIAGLLILGFGMSAFVRGVHYGIGTVLTITKWEIILNGVGLVALTICLLLGARGASLLIPTALTQLLIAVRCWPQTGRNRAGRELAREIDGFLAIAVLGSIASMGLMHIALLVCRQVAGSVGAGHYSAALAIATPLTILTNAYGQALQPALAEAYGAGDYGTYWRIADKATRQLVSVLGLILALTALLAAPIVRFVWGEGFGDSAALLAVLLAAVFVRSVAVPSVNALSSSTNRGLTVTLVASQLGLLAAVGYWVLSRGTLDPLGVAIGYFIGVTVTSAVCCGSAWRKGHLAWSLTTVMVACAAIVMVGPALLRSAGIAVLSPQQGALLAAGYIAAWTPLAVLSLRSKQNTLSEQVESAVHD